MIFLFISLAIFVFIFLINHNKIKKITNPNKKQIICPKDEKICSDGKIVVRIPPNCEFAPCNKHSPNNKKIDKKQQCGKMGEYKPCPEGYACKFQKGINIGLCEKCPETGYIDCMPGPYNFDSKCNPEYVNWAKENCPGFHGVVY